MREAPSRTLMEALWQAGARVRAYDPEAMDEARRIYGERSDLTLCSSPEDTLQGSDALVVITNGTSSGARIFEIKETLKEPVIFDGRNLYEPRRCPTGICLLRHRPGRTDRRLKRRAPKMVPAEGLEPPTY